VPGFTVNRYRIVRAGTNAVRERWIDKYPPTAQIVRVGTGDSKSSDPEVKDDSHPEYTADELLVLTQGENLGESALKDAASGRESLEWREPGKTGEPGWTKTAKMPQWDSREATHTSASPRDPKQPMARRGNG
jgi:hypothetical protein